MGTHQFGIDNFVEAIAGNHLDMLKNLEDMSNNLNKFRKQLQDLVYELEKPYYQRSQEIYKMKLQESTQEKMDRYVFNDLLNNESFVELLVERISLYVNSKYSALHLAPGYGEIADSLVSCTPLYLMDDHADMLQAIRKWREPPFQRRLRYYIFDDANNDPCHELPENHFSLIVAVNWFNFRTEDILKHTLKSMMKILRPGGVIIFTYNNCDYPKAIDKVDEMYYCYTTSTKVKDVCTQLGYEIIKSFNKGHDELDMGISWLEIKKPGTLNTIKTSETMAEIKNLGEN